LPSIPLKTLESKGNSISQVGGQVAAAVVCNYQMLGMGVRGYYYIVIKYIVAASKL
jgi:hypothetical protein